MIRFGNAKALVNYANVSYFTQICSRSEGSSKAQIKLPKPVPTNVLAQCLTNF